MFMLEGGMIVDPVVNMVLNIIMLILCAVIMYVVANIAHTLEEMVETLNSRPSYVAPEAPTIEVKTSEVNIREDLLD